MINFILMADTALKEKNRILEEKVADETFKELMSLNKKSRPKKINLYGANPQHLVKVMLALQDRFKKIKYRADIFIEGSGNGEYSVDVGYYLKKFKNLKYS